MNEYANIDRNHVCWSCIITVSIRYRECKVAFKGKIPPIPGVGFKLDEISNGWYGIFKV